MIRIQRPLEVPETLHEKGKTLREALEREFLEHEGAVRSGEHRLVFDRGVFAARDVKQALIDMQNGKCAFI